MGSLAWTKWPVVALGMLLPVAALCQQANLELSAEIPKESEVYHVIPVTLLLVNSGSSDVVILDLGELRHRIVSVELRTTELDQVVYKGPSGICRSIDDRSRGEIFLPAGHRRSIPIRLACRWAPEQYGTPFFTEPGKFKIRFSTSIIIKKNGTPTAVAVQSPWLELRISDFARGDSDAFRAMRALPHPAWLFDPAENFQLRNPEEQKAYEDRLLDFLKRYPQSKWMPYVRLSLAHIYVTRLASEVTHGERKSLRQAQEQMRSLESVKDFPLSDRCEDIREIIRVWSTRLDRK